MDLLAFIPGLASRDLVVGASVYFPPVFKAILAGFFIWMIIHKLLREWIYSGDVWHPTLMDLSLFVLSVGAGLLLLVVCPYS